MRLLLVILLATAAAWFTYWRLEQLGARAWPAALARAVAWAALGLLVLDLTCAVRGPTAGRPLVLLDASLSMTAAGGRWAEALDSARARGEVRLFGDAAPFRDTLPAFGRSDLEPALRAAAASDRPVLIISDGELTDRDDVAPDLLARAGVLLLPRATAPDLAVVRVSGPARATAGDTVRLDVEVRAFGGGPDTARVTVSLGDRVLGRQSIRLGADGNSVATLVLPTAGLSGDLPLRIGLSGHTDAEPRDDARLHLLRVSPTPGIVLLASPPDWDSRFLFQALRDVADLPLRAYLRMGGGGWRSMSTLAPVSAEEVQQAARRADVLVVKGSAPEALRATSARGRWLWPSGEGGETTVTGDWYAAAGASSPVASAFVGLPVDSFPPLVSVTPIEPAADDWIGVTAQLTRRGADRPVLVGTARPGRREVLTAADGFWRWSFRGGAGEQAYRAMVAGTLSWLLGGADSAAGRARLPRPVVSNGRPAVFEWSGTGPAMPTAIVLSGGDGTRTDTLEFDGSGRAELWLPPGIYAYQLEGGGRGTLAVDRWSEEWLPRPSQLEAQPISAPPTPGLTSARRWLWLFGLALLGLTVEWLYRRRLGLR
ncbi:MAG: hypothetical protein JNM53_05045 [Gemmatimonadetes bacterium]|nr:hypothetical protein [Gemmatimonadota bacterium]